MDCTYHIYSKREFFSGLELENGVGYIGNNTPYKIKGIGEVRLQMHNETSRSLIDVQFVSDMKKYLNSLGVLVGKCLEINLANSGLKATKGTLVVIKYIWKNLFYLQGTYRVAQL